MAQIAVDQPNDPPVAVRQHPPEILVDQPAPSVAVRQPAPHVDVEQAPPQVHIDQPAPHVEIQSVLPDIEVRQAPPRVRVEQRPPKVEVHQAEPEVRLQSDAARVEVETERPNVVIQHTEPTVVITRGPAPLLPFSAVTGRTLLSEDGSRIGVIERVMVERRSDRLYAIVSDSAGLKRAVPYPVLKRNGRVISAPQSVSRRYDPRNFAPVPPDRVVE